MKLSTLRSRLHRLKRRRAMVRRATAWSAPVLAVLWLAVAVFVIDWQLIMDVPQRIVALLLSALVAGWVFWRFTRPWLGVREDVVDVALLVEKHQHIDCDLVAALQFQQPQAQRWGSTQLEAAVIDYVEEFSPSLNVFEGFTYRRFKRRMLWLLGTIALVLSSILVFPDYARAFANRLLLGSMHYPTDTQIERIVLNGQTVYVPNGESLTITCAYGTPLDFEVHGRGVLPEAGRAQLMTEELDNPVEIELLRGLPTQPAMTSERHAKREKLPEPASSSLEPSDDPSPIEKSPTGQAAYYGRLPRLVNPVTYQIYLGDAWTDPLAIRVIPLPLVTVTLNPRPPEYATALKEGAAEVREGTRQIAVIEGTSVDVELACNNKRLANAVLTVEDQSYPLVRTADGHRWTLSGPDSPLYEIRQPVSYSLQVKDEDGLALEQPITGSIRIRTDRPPRFGPPELVTSLVLPKAKPTVDFTVTDDYGLSRLKINVQIVRQVPMTEDAPPEDTKDEVDHLAREMITVEPSEQPKRSLSGRYALNLESFKLAAGDELKVTLEAFDYRGAFASQSSLSEPLVLKVTDLQGVLAGMRDADERSAQNIDHIIEISSGDTK